MTSWPMKLMLGSAILVGGTGLVYAVMRYLMEPADPWAVINHPWQPLVQHLHVLVAPLLVFGVGLLWSGHVMRRYRSGEKRGRLSGCAAALSAAPMVLSGYLIQVTTAPSWRLTWVVIHVATSLFWMVGFAVHQVVARRRLDSAAPLADPGPAEPWN